MPLSQMLPSTLVDMKMRRPPARRTRPTALISRPWRRIRELRGPCLIDVGSAPLSCSRGTSLHGVERCARACPALRPRLRGASREPGLLVAAPCSPWRPALRRDEVDRAKSRPLGQFGHTTAAMRSLPRRGHEISKALNAHRSFYIGTSLHLRAMHHLVALRYGVTSLRLSLFEESLFAFDMLS